MRLPSLFTLLWLLSTAAAAVNDTPKITRGFWSHRETADYLGLPEQTLYQLDYKGTGPKSYKLGRHRKYRPADVERWCEERASDAGRSA